MDQRRVRGEDVPHVPRLDATAACVLGLLLLGPAPGMPPASDGAMTGWQLYETATRSIARFWNVTRSQIYLELSRLANAGLVEQAGQQQQPAARAKRPYRITAAGHAAFVAWLSDFAAEDPREDLLRSPLLLVVFFGEHLPPPTLRRVLEEYRPRWQRQLELTSAMYSAIGERDRTRPPSAVLRRGVRYRELMVRWIDELLADLSQADRTAGGT